MKTLEDYAPIDHSALGSDSPDYCDFEHLQQIPDRRVWTVVEGDDESLHACAGFHIVNVVYYIVTEHPWQDVETAFEIVEGKPFA